MFCIFFYTTFVIKYNNKTIMAKKYIFLIFFILFFCPVFTYAEQININAATLSQLDELTGIGPTYAQRIIDARPFSSIDDLNRVKGIGPATIQKIKNQGFACVNCQTTQITVEPQKTEAVQNTVSAQTPASEPNEATNKALAPVYPGGVFINEVLPNPEGPDETDEWIELYNSNNFDVDLYGWQIQDVAGTITTYTILKDTKILANGFLVFKRPDTKIMLNNDIDGLNLLTPDKKISDSMTFAKAPLNQSYNKINSGWQWSSTLSPGATNIITAAQTKTSNKVLPKNKNSVNNNGVEAAAAINETTNPIRNEISNGASPWFLFFTALAITIISASLILFIKLKFQKNVRT